MRLRSLIAAAGWCCVGCVSPQQAAMTDVNPIRWDKEVWVSLPDRDTVAPYDLWIVLRYDEPLRCDTLRLTIRTLSPDSLAYEEPFTCGIPAARSAAALGREAAIPYRRRVLFPGSGEYRIGIRPTSPVRGMRAVGIRLEQSERAR